MAIDPATLVSSAVQSVPLEHGEVVRRAIQEVIAECELVQNRIISHQKAWSLLIDCLSQLPKLVEDLQDDNRCLQTLEMVKGVLQAESPCVEPNAKRLRLTANVEAALAVTSKEGWSTTWGRTNGWKKMQCMTTQTT